MGSLGAAEGDKGKNVAPPPAEVVPAEANEDADRPDRPEPPDRPEQSRAVKDMVASFKEARQEFLAEQARLRQELKKASKEQRDALREQLKENLQEWIAEQKRRVRDEVAQRDAMRERVNDLRAVLEDSGRGNGRDR